jgi:hypothetical protein
MTVFEYVCWKHVACGRILDPEYEGEMMDPDYTLADIKHITRGHAMSHLSWSAISVDCFPLYYGDGHHVLKWMTVFEYICWKQLACVRVS